MLCKKLKHLKLILCNKCNVHVTCLMCMLHHSRCGPSRWSLDITRLSMGLLDGLKTPRNFSSGDWKGEMGLAWPWMAPTGEPHLRTGKSGVKGGWNMWKDWRFQMISMWPFVLQPMYFHWDHWGFLTAWPTFWNSSSVSAHSTICSTISALKLENHRWEQQAPNQGHKEWELRLLAPFET